MYTMHTCASFERSCRPSTWKQWPLTHEVGWLVNWYQDPSLFVAWGRVKPEVWKLPVCRSPPLPDGVGRRRLAALSGLPDSAARRQNFFGSYCNSGDGPLRNIGHMWLWNIHLKSEKPSTAMVWNKCFSVTKTRGNYHRLCSEIKGNIVIKNISLPVLAYGHPLT